MSFRLRFTSAGSTRVRRPSRTETRRGRIGLGPAACGFALLVALAAPAVARDPAPFQARGGLELAAAAARSWAADAALIYVENDDPIDPRGGSVRWGYLFFSPSQEKARIYSVKDGKILVAENLEMRLEAPPLAAEWIDSGMALEAAEKSAGRAFRKENQGGQLGTMLLMRGAFQDEDPDQTTWTLIYTAPGAPSLFVVVDAAEGKVRKTWRG
jgi:hypothetical protein